MTQLDSAHLPAAVLWDFDGTLADTEPLWIAAEFELADSLGAAWSLEQAHELVGMALLDSAALLLAGMGRPDLEPAWVVQQLIGRVVQQIETGTVPWCRGAVELLTALRAAGVPTALVSASYRVLLDAIIDRLPAGSFTTSVAGDEVGRGKPDPECYLTACTLLGVAPTDCVVLEDSIPGCAAGNAAGAVVVAIENLVPVPDASARFHVGSLTEVDPAWLGERQREGAASRAR